MIGLSAPRPQGHYVPARRHGDLIFVAGMTPRRDGAMQFAGKVAQDGSVAACRAAVELATGNALLAAASVLTAGERLTALALTVYVNAHPDFTRHSALADIASRLIAQQLGNAHLPSRTAVGVASLPDDAMIEIALVAAAVQSPR